MWDLFTQPRLNSTHVKFPNTEQDKRSQHNYDHTAFLNVLLFMNCIRQTLVQ